MSVVVIGSSPTVDSLRLLGFEVVRVPEKLGKAEEDEVVAKILESRVALVESEVYASVAERLRQVMSFVKEPPLLVVIPSSEKASTRRLEELYNKLSMALGVRLRWAKKEE
ncbi:V-type ATP synthase subunit F [Thermofilum pendens]|uniref:V-type ATP synthase subunit F n=1 Tax=Thermofilum pendens TaxID=2269 RepID=UPI001650D0AA|nr:V-type ATP synthase subunit F [Thermofilum pendens]